jgi:pimeloyl-ACP methyl ester carboxylesterase
MSTIVLVHGGWHAAWCWLRLLPFLEGSGHRVLAPDLPGHGEDRTPLSAKPYEMYVPTVTELLERIQDRVILVGHSSGGMIITEAFRRSSRRIKALVYLSAFLLPPGKTLGDIMPINYESLLSGCLEIDSANGVSIVRKDCAKTVFYGDCSDEDAAWAISRLQPEPLIPRTAHSSDEGWPPDATDCPRRFYIECLQDRALTPRAQQWMYSTSRCDAVYSLPTSHSPFLSTPALLAERLLEIEHSISTL